MSRITLTNVSKSYGTVEVLHDINLDIGDGELDGLRRPVRLRQVDAAAA